MHRCKSVHRPSSASPPNVHRMSPGESTAGLPDPPCEPARTGIGPGPGGCVGGAVREGRESLCGAPSATTPPYNTTVFRALRTGISGNVAQLLDRDVPRPHGARRAYAACSLALIANWPSRSNPRCSLRHRSWWGVVPTRPLTSWAKGLLAGFTFRTVISQPEQDDERRVSLKYMVNPR